MVSPAAVAGDLLRAGRTDASGGAHCSAAFSGHREERLHDDRAASRSPAPRSGSRTTSAARALALDQHVPGRRARPASRESGSGRSPARSSSTVIEAGSGRTAAKVRSSALSRCRSACGQVHLGVRCRWSRPDVVPTSCQRVVARPRSCGRRGGAVAAAARRARSIVSAPSTEADGVGAGPVEPGRRPGRQVAARRRRPPRRSGRRGGCCPRRGRGSRRCRPRTNTSSPTYAESCFSTLWPLA